MTIYKFDLKSKFFNACSCEIFGDNKNRVNEETIKKPVSVYGLSKSISLELVKFFEKFDLKCCSGILFHHESEFRKNNL